MKRIAYFLFLLLFPLITVRGEMLTNGIFITVQDLATNKVSEQTKTDDLNTVVVNLDNNVLLIRKGVEQHYKFGTLSGYYKDGYRYRAFGKKSIFSTSGYYKVLDDAGLIIYSKRSGNHKTGGKTFYYYSTGWDAPVRKLTRRNLKEDFSYDPVFVDAATSTLQGQVFLTEKNGHLLINDLYLSRTK
ncbi:MAG TPA: hypothetical protein VIU12_23745 [Chryseolinea sp.]